MPDDSHDVPDLSDNPYAAPTTVSQPVEGVVDADSDPLRVFVGPRASYYLSNWGPKLDGRGQVRGFNIGAFFFTGMWLAYRKMYKWSFIFFGLILIESIFEEILFLVVLEMPETPPAISLAINIAIGVTFGVMGNGWYLAHARREVSAAQDQGLQGTALMLYIAHRGGTNFAAAFGVVILFFIAAVAASFLLEMTLFPDQWEKFLEG